MFRALKKFDQAIMVGTGFLVSFSIFGYMIDDNCRCEKKRYENEIARLKEILKAEGNA